MDDQSLFALHRAPEQATWKQRAPILQKSEAHSGQGQNQKRNVGDSIPNTLLLGTVLAHPAHNSSQPPRCAMHPWSGRSRVADEDGENREEEETPTSTPWTLANVDFTSPVVATIAAGFYSFQPPWRTTTFSRRQSAAWSQSVLSTTCPPSGTNHTRATTHRTNFQRFLLRVGWRSLLVSGGTPLRSLRDPSCLGDRVVGLESVLGSSPGLLRLRHHLLSSRIGDGVAHVADAHVGEIQHLSLVPRLP